MWFANANTGLIIKYKKFLFKYFLIQKRTKLQEYNTDYILYINTAKCYTFIVLLSTRVSVNKYIQCMKFSNIEHASSYYSAVLRYIKYD